MPSPAEKRARRAKTPARPAYDGPPDYRAVGRHGMFPDISHDEAARFNFLAHLNRHLATQLMPGVAEAFEAHVSPAFRQAEGRAFADRHEVRKALLGDPAFQWWSALRRATMESRQQAGRWVSLRQADALAAAAAAATDGDPRLRLDPTLAPPRPVAAIDHHCMPGSYHTELKRGDVSGAANYDIGLFATTGGALGAYNDGGGQAVIAWTRRNMPDLAPKRILDLGAGLGHNVLPIAAAFPSAEVVAVDVGAPMLRYGLARAKSLGLENITFVQGDAADLKDFPDGGFDWIQSTMFLHETSYQSLKAIFRETERLLAPGGIVLHVEQPQYTDAMPLFEQAMRDWDAFYNNEPFWTKLHAVDLDGWMVEAGFPAESLIHGAVAAVGASNEGEDQEDYGRKAAWRVIGARKPGGGGPRPSP